MDALRIEQLDLRYRLPPGQQSAGDRLDRVLAGAMEDLLDGALLRVGVPVDEEICVREVAAAPVRIRLESPDPAVALQWALAFAEAVKAAIDRGGSEVVRYRTRHQALLDLVLCAAEGDLRRAWAWRRLGLWPDEPSRGDALPADAFAVARQSAAVLARHPQAAIGVVRELARRGRLAAWWARLGAESMRELARAVLLASGADEVAAAGLLELSATARGAGGPFAPEASRALTASPVGRALAASQEALAAAGAVDRTRRASLRALAILALEDVAPGFARSTRAMERLDTVEVRALGPQAGGDPGAGVHERGVPRKPGRAEAATAQRTRASRPAGADHPAKPLPEAATELAEAELEQPASTARAGVLFLLHLLGRSTSSGLPATGAVRNWPQNRQAEADREGPHPGAQPAGSVQAANCGQFPTGTSSDPLRLHEALAADPALAGRGFRWALHALAMRLAGAEAEDPAALAFAGLMPGTTPPSRGAPPATDSECEALDAHAAALTRSVRERLEAAARSAGDRSELCALGDAALLDLLCRRRGVVVADPGWLEIRLELDEVSVELRRAGLDLDPGWLPWLGVVVRFTYA